MERRALAAFALPLSFVLALSAQRPVNQANGPPSGIPIQTVLVYSGNSVIAKCWSPSTIPQKAPGNVGQRLTRTVSISAATNASPTVLTSTGHTFTLGTRPNVTISGGTGSWTAINGTFVATIIDANTFSIPVNATSFSALTRSITFTTTAPRQGIAEWAVQLIHFVGTSNVQNLTWLNGTSAFVNKCTDATNAGVNTQ